MHNVREMKVLSHEADGLSGDFHERVTSLKRRYSEIARGILAELIPEGDVGADLRVATGEGRGLRVWLGQYVRQPLAAIRSDVLRNPALAPMRRLRVAALALLLLWVRWTSWLPLRLGLRLDPRPHWG